MSRAAAFFLRLVKTLKKESKAEAEQRIKAKALSFLHSAPEADVLLHLDFHFLNIMYTGKEYKIIDWVDAKRGNPVFDYARTYIMFYQYIKPCLGDYLREVLKTGFFSEEELMKACFVSALRRLEEKTPQGEVLNQLIKDLDEKLSA